MTAQEIATALTANDITAPRIKKLRALCQRSNVDLSAVFACLTDEQRQQIAAVGG